MSELFAAALERERTSPDWSPLLEERAGTAEGWAVPEAFVAVLLTAVTCDGDLAAIEHEELLALAHRSRALMSLTARQLAEINVKVAQRLRDSDDALAQACAAVPQEMRLSLFAHALDLALADGDLSQEEADLLNALVVNFELDGGAVRRITDVIVLKNRY